MDYEIFNNKKFFFDNEKIELSIDYIEELAPSDALLLLDGIDLTGYKLWEGSIILCDYVVNNKELFKLKSVLELGTGVGITGILASHYASQVVLTDGSESILNLTKKNIVQNNLSSKVACEKLYWGELEEFKQKYPQKFDIIMGGDLIYGSEAIEPLLNTVNELLTDSGMFIVIYINRSIASLGEKFIDYAKNLKFTCKVYPTNEKIDGEIAYIYVFERDKK